MIRIAAALMLGLGLTACERIKMLRTCQNIPNGSLWAYESSGKMWIRIDNGGQSSQWIPMHKESNTVKICAA